jgi:hypothetical protein
LGRISTETLAENSTSTPLRHLQKKKAGGEGDLGDSPKKGEIDTEDVSDDVGYRKEESGVPAFKEQ